MLKYINNDAIFWNWILICGQLCYQRLMSLIKIINNPFLSDSLKIEDTKQISVYKGYVLRS